MNPIKEYGWRFLALGERRVKGDECWAEDRWKPCFFSLGLIQSERTTFSRRRINPGTGFEIIHADEIISGFVEQTTDGVNWSMGAHEHSDRYPAAWFLFQGILAFRRAKSEWIDIKVCKPNIGTQIWWAHPTKGILLSNYSGGGWQQLMTHWRPVKPGEIPDPPKAQESVKTQAELDHEASAKWYLNESDAADELCEKALRQAYEAGLKAGRAK